MLITTRQKRQNLTLKCPSIFFGDQTVNEVDSHESALGVTTDCSLSWSSHVTGLCKSTSKTKNLLVIKRFVSLHARKVFFHAQVQSIIDYGSTLWDSASVVTIKPWVSLHKTVLKTTAQNWGGKFSRTALDWVSANCDDQRLTCFVPAVAVSVARGSENIPVQPALSPFLTGRMFVRWTYFGQFDELWFVS